MAEYRQIHTSMWSYDTWFSSLKPAQKLLFIYLFSNGRASACGLYELPIGIISSNTGLPTERILQAFEVFAEADKVKYDPETGVVWVKNMFKFQASSSPKLLARIQADIRAVPDCELKDEAMRYLGDRVGMGSGSGSGTTLSVSGSGSLSGSVSEGEGVQGERETRDPQVAAEKPGLPRDGQVWEAYERNIGAMTPLVTASLGDDESEYGAESVCAAIQEAVKHEARNLKYVEAILARWKREGFKARLRKPSTARGSPGAGRKSAAEVHEMLEGWLQEAGGMTATTRADIASVIALLKACFPNYNPEPDTAEVFYRLLSDMSPDLLEAAVIACITQRGRAFAPSIGEIRGAAAELQKQVAGLPTALEALNEVLAMPADMRDHLHKIQNEAGEWVYDLKHRTFSHALVEIVARRMGWPDRFPGDNAAVDRAQFTRTYEAEVERILGLAAAHPALAAYVARHAFEDSGPPVPDWQRNAIPPG